MKKTQKHTKTKQVILIGEEHGTTGHLERVPNLIEKQLKKDQEVIFALEQNLEGKRKITSFLICRRKKRGIHRKASVVTPSAKIKQFTDNLVFDSKKMQLEYMGCFKQILDSVEKNNKEVFIVGIDKAVDRYQKESSERDRVMYNEIKNALDKSNANLLICPVGSAHIHNTEDKQQGLRLGALLSKDSAIKLSLKNYYSSESQGHRLAFDTVNRDINDLLKYCKENNLKEPEVQTLELDQVSQRVDIGEFDWIQDTKPKTRRISRKKGDSPPKKRQDHERELETKEVDDNLLKEEEFKEAAEVLKKYDVKKSDSTLKASDAISSLPKAIGNQKEKGGIKK